MSDVNFAYIEFEHGDIEEIIGELWRATRCEVVAVCFGELVVGFEDMEFTKFSELAKQAVWKHNDGLYCSVVPRSYEDIEYLL